MGLILKTRIKIIQSCITKILIRIKLLSKKRIIKETIVHNLLIIVKTMICIMRIEARIGKCMAKILLTFIKILTITICKKTINTSNQFGGDEN